MQAGQISKIGSGPEHIPVLDGLRGIAVLLVLTIHLAPDVQMPSVLSEWIKKAFTTAGWIGVDLFFVLSGFLITSILLRSKSEPRYFRNFYMRRTLRIFPLYFLAACLIFVVLPNAVVTPLYQSQTYVWLYLTNVGMWIEGASSFVNRFIDVRPLWSLAVEEHFYLAWPAVVFVLRERALAVVILVLLLTAPAFRFAGYDSYLTIARWDVLAAGALLALIFRSPQVDLRRLSWLAVALFATSTAAILTMFYALKGLWASAHTVNVYGITLLAIAFSSAIFLLLVYPRSFVCRVISSGPLRFFGRYSYGLYVVHSLSAPAIILFLSAEPWLQAFGPALGSVLIFITRAAACTIVAVILWHGFEAPFLRLKRYFP